MVATLLKADPLNMKFFLPPLVLVLTSWPSKVVYDVMGKKKPVSERYDDFATKNLNSGTGHLTSVTFLPNVVLSTISI